RDFTQDLTHCLFVTTQGTAPNRTFYIEWYAVYFNSGGVRANFEVRLYENQSRFDFIYGSVNNGGSATIGVQRDTGSLSTQFECNAGGLVPGLQLAFSQASCPVPTPTFTPTPSYTPTPTDTPTFTDTPTNTTIPTHTPTFTPAPTHTPTF